MGDEVYHFVQADLGAEEKVKESERERDRTVVALRRYRGDEQSLEWGAKQPRQVRCTGVLGVVPQSLAVGNCNLAFKSLAVV